MKQFIINHVNGRQTNLVSQLEVRSVTSATQNMALLGEDTVTLSVVSAKTLQFGIGDTMRVNGRTYTINTLPSCKKTSARKYEYTIVLEGPQYQLINTIWLLPDNTQRDSFTGNLADFMSILHENITRLYQGWNEPIVEMGVDYEDKYNTLTYTDQNCLQVLQDLCTQFGAEFYIKDEADGTCTIHMQKKVGTPFSYTFEYGAGGGIYELTRNAQENTDLITRVYCFGSSNNLPNNYGYDRLCMPYDGDGNRKNASYVEDVENIRAFGVHEGVMVDDEIFPQYKGKVTSVGSNEKTFTDADFPFDLGEVDGKGNSKYLQNGVNAKITFQTGNLAGYEFEIDRDAYKYDKTSGLKVVLISYKDDVGLTLPMPSSESAGARAYQFAVGDEYIISNIYMPEAFITEAENKLKEKGLEYLEQYKAPQVSYSLTIDDKFLERVAGTDKMGVRNLFAVGDTITVTDNTIGGTSGLRITSFDRDLLRPYKYSLTLGDKVKVTTITRIMKELTETQTIIRMNKLDDPSRAIRNWKTTQEVLSSVFDQDGDYFTEKIKPLSIETSMLAVGARPQQFGLNGSVFKPNYGGDPNHFVATDGILTHYTIQQVGSRTWELRGCDVAEMIPTSLYYIYATCPRSLGVKTGNITISTEQKTVESESNYYNFLVGTISSVIEGARQITLSYGSTMINGRFINTGRIQSADQLTYFDLDTGEIHGNITFTGSDGNETSALALEAKTQSINNYVYSTITPTLEDLQSQLDGQIEQFFYTYDPTTTNAPANEWTTEIQKLNHLGDLFYNTDNGKGWRWGKDANGNYKWVALNDTDTAKALEVAQSALSEARTRQRIFSVEPFPPYNVGDLWVRTDGKVYKCTADREDGVYVSTEWAEYSDFASKNDITDLTNQTNASLLEMQSALDGKIETWYQESDPSRDWNTTQKNLSHVGDLWIRLSNGVISRYMRNESGLFGWAEIADPMLAADAYDMAEEASNNVERKTQTFIITPYPPYNVADLWLNNGELLRCVTARASNERFRETDWTEATYYDNTQTTIDGGVITSGNLQIVGTNSKAVVAGITGADSGDNNTDADDIRIWAGSDKRTRDKAPFRVDQSGHMWAENATISGTIDAKLGEIGGFTIADDHIGYRTEKDSAPSAEGYGMSLYNDFIKFADKYRCAVIGRKGQDTVGGLWSDTASFINSYPTSIGTNIALYSKAVGAKLNLAILAEGNIVCLNGNSTDTGFKRVVWNYWDYASYRGTQYDMTAFVKRLLIRHGSCLSGSNYYHQLALPTLEQVCASLMINRGTPFVLEGEFLKVCANKSDNCMATKILCKNYGGDYDDVNCLTICTKSGQKSEYLTDNDVIRYRLVSEGYNSYYCIIEE